MDDSIRAYYNHFITALETIYEASEATVIAQRVFEDKLLVKPHNIHNWDKNLLISELHMMEDILGRLLKHEPLQYVLGECEFYRLPFQVNRHVLIPRRETEELVDKVIQDLKRLDNKSVRLLDIGTGSGCIAISIKKHIPQAAVVALDISSDALRVAGANAELNEVQIEFVTENILAPAQKLTGVFDVIVSNPPYITPEEKVSMDKNVLWHEPHEALFVTDNDPLQFYRAIVNIADKQLKEKGNLYMEINEAFPSQVKSLLEERSFRNITLWNDLQGKPRFASAVK